MRPRILHVLLLAAAVSLAGCRQGDGEPPAKSGDVPNRLADLRRDLESVTSGDPRASQDLADDLVVFTEEPEGMTAARALSTTLSSMLAKRSLNEDALMRLATMLWTAVAAHDLSERQVDALKDDMRGFLTSIGVSQPDANLAAGRVGDVQKAVTLRSRRWYERY
jgi:hypothetical protein